MPNGLPGHSETDWAEWRGEITSLVKEGLAWMKRHESEEFSYHREVGAHIAETKGFIAQSMQHRAELAHRVEVLEITMGRLDRDMEGVKTRMNLLFATMIPIALSVAGFVIMQLWDHLKTP